MSVRDSFVEHFGEEQTKLVEAAAEAHDNEVHPNRGTDPFKWVIAICLGFDCLSCKEYMESHDIDLNWEDVEQWIKDHGKLGTHDGDVDYMAALCGVYAPFVGDQEDEESNC